MASKATDSNTVEKILRAAKQCYIEDGIRSTGMKEVARAANLARSTLYCYFPSKDDVLVAVIIRELEAASVAIQKKLQRYDQPADILVEGLVLALKEIPKHPLLVAVLTSDEDSKARSVIWSSNILVLFREQLLGAVMQPALEQGLLQDKVRPEIMVEWIHRILLSFLTLPSNWIRSEKELRATLHALLVPGLLR